MKFLNHYECPVCRARWVDEWDCKVDDDCPECGERHIESFESDDVSDEEDQ